MSLWLSALNVKYRDVGAPDSVPGSDLDVRLAGRVPGQPGAGTLASLYGLNPMVTVVEGFRWSLLGTPPPDRTLALIGFGADAGDAGRRASCTSRPTERTFADVI